MSQESVKDSQEGQIVSRLGFFQRKMDGADINVYPALLNQLRVVADAEVARQALPWELVKTVSTLREGIFMSKSILESPQHIPNPERDAEILKEIQAREEQLRDPELAPAIKAIDAVNQARENLPAEVREALR